MTDREQHARIVQERVLGVLLLVHAALCVVAVRSWLAAGAGVAMALAVRALGRAGWPPLAPMTPAIVWMGASMLLFFANIHAQFPMTAVSAGTLVLGCFAVLGFWAVNRYAGEPARPRPIGPCVVESVTIGLFMSLALSLIASVIFMIAMLVAPEDPDLRLGNLAVITLSYVMAGIVGGSIVGVLRPLAVWPLGRMALGIPVAAVAYGSVGAAMYVMGASDGPESWSSVLFMGVGIGVIAGPMGALMFHQGVQGAGPDLERGFVPSDGDDAA